MQFRDRRDAGRRLAVALRDLAGEDTVVLGLPRGGVPVAYEVAAALDAALDVLVVRKVGAPHNPEYGIGAVGEGGVELLNADALRALGITRADVEGTVTKEREELERRLERYRSGRPPVEVAGRVAVVVDDGLATGVSASAAVEVLRARGAGRVVVAVPVGAPESVERVRERADEVVCLHAPASFMAVGSWYADFSQTRDDEVMELLSRAYDGRAGATGSSGDGPASREEVTVDAAGVALPGYLDLPEHARGVVVFAHGSGSSRDSPRNQQVARALHDAGQATLLFDLLTAGEAGNRANVFDIPLLAERLVAAVRWLRGRDDTRDLPVGLFGASTGAAAALVAAAELGDDVAAVVSRGGRPDLAGDALAKVHAPALLIVGGRDHEVLELNRQAAQRLTAPHDLAIVEGAGHLFEEPGALEQVADHAARWFAERLR